MRKLWSEIDAPVIIFLAALFFFIETDSLPPPRFEPMGPAFFPKLVLTGIMILSLYNVLAGLVQHFRKASTEGEGQIKIVNTSQLFLLLSTLALYTVFILVIVYTNIHFVFLAFLFICVLGFILVGSIKEHFVSIVLTAAGVSGTIYLVFGLLLENFFP